MDGVLFTRMMARPVDKPAVKKNPVPQRGAPWKNGVDISQAMITVGDQNDRIAGFT
jgi:hypothetical protein